MYGLSAATLLWFLILALVLASSRFTRIFSCAYGEIWNFEQFLISVRITKSFSDKKCLFWGWSIYGRLVIVSASSNPAHSDDEMATNSLTNFALVGFELRLCVIGAACNDSIFTSLQDSSDVSASGAFRRCFLALSRELLCWLAKLFKTATATSIKQWL